MCAIYKTKYMINKKTKFKTPSFNVFVIQVDPDLCLKVVREACENVV